MYLVPALDTKEEVLNVLNQIEISEEPGAAGY